MDTLESKAIETFIEAPINGELVHKVIVRTLQIIPCDSTTMAINDNKRLPSLLKFLNKLIQALKLNNGILMSTIVYLNRLQAKLPANCKGLPSTRHRILLSCLILSIKFNNDFSLKNHDWLKLTNRLFNLKDINLMERQLLYLLNWNLFVNEFELFHHFGKFLGPIKEKLLDGYRMKQYLSQQQQKALSPKSPSPRSSMLVSSPRSPLSIKSAHSPTPFSPLVNFATVPNSRKLSSSLVSSFMAGEMDSIQNTRKGSECLMEALVESYEVASMRCLNYKNTGSNVPTLKVLIPNEVNPLIELTALNEQYELNKLLQSFKHSL